MDTSTPILKSELTLLDEAAAAYLPLKRYLADLTNNEDAASRVARSVISSSPMSFSNPAVQAVPPNGTTYSPNSVKITIWVRMEGREVMSQ